MRAERRPARSVYVGGAALIAFTAVAGLVAGGATTRVDQYAVDHSMPGLYPYVGGGELVSLPRGRLVSTWNPDRLLNHVADRVTLPASIPVVTAAVLLVLVLSKRVDRRAWLLAYVVALAAELIGKSAIHGRTLFVPGETGPLRLWKFDDSFPSGSALRAVFLAGLVGTAWPVLTAPAALWAASVVALLVLAGTHTPSDVLGGVLLAIALVALARRVPRPLTEARSA